MFNSAPSIVNNNIWYTSYLKIFLFQFQIHGKGLKLGIYADMGLYTCKKYPGSKFYLQLDAETFASWGVDMLKLDCCWAGSLEDLETGTK